jgi:biopolymer transport protein ExbD
MLRALALVLLITSPACASAPPPRPSVPVLPSAPPAAPPLASPPRASPPLAAPADVPSPSACAALAAAVGSSAPAAQLVVDGRGMICFEGEPAADDDELEARARRFATEHGSRDVILYVDGQVPYARVIELMDVLRRGGLDHVALAVQPGSP